MWSISNLERLIAGQNLSRKTLPRHIAIDGGDERASHSQEVILGLLHAQVKMNIALMTVYPGTDPDSLIPFFRMLKENQLIIKNRIKFSFLGKWYDSSGGLVEEIRALIDRTKDHDKYFFNFCLNYDGQQEIVDSCKIIARKIKAGKIDIDVISRELMKENIYSSYFLPPDIMIVAGTRRRVTGLLLWDSPGAFYCFPKKKLSSFTESDLLRCVLDYLS